MTFPDSYRVDLDPAQFPLIVGQWRICRPEHHPLWQWYLLSVVSLRDMDGVSPANKLSPEMTHELTVLAVNPDFNEQMRRHYPAESGRNYTLEPVNVVVQFRATDAIAERVGRFIFENETSFYWDPSGIRGARERWTATVIGLAKKFELEPEPTTVTDSDVNDTLDSSSTDEAENA